MKPLRASLLTVSDRVARGDLADRGGARTAEILEAAGIEVVERVQVPDERKLIEEEIERLVATSDLVVTTGGTGIGPRDVTPEATLAVLDRRLPGMEEAMRAKGLTRTPLAVLSRAVAGSRSGCLVVNLPGSPRGIEDGLGAILPAVPHAVELLRAGVRDCAPARERFEPTS